MFPKKHTSFHSTELQLILRYVNFVNFEKRLINVSVAMCSWQFAYCRHLEKCLVI